MYKKELKKLTDSFSQFVSENLETIKNNADYDELYCIVKHLNNFMEVNK